MMGEWLSLKHSSTLCRDCLKFETRLISSKVEHFDGFGIIHILLTRKFVEAWQTYDSIPVLARHSIFPNVVRNVEIKFVRAFTCRTDLALEAARVVCVLSYSHQPLLPFPAHVTEQRPYHYEKHWTLCVHEKSPVGGFTSQGIKMRIVHYCRPCACRHQSAGGFNSTGKPAACQASQPPTSARALLHPAFCNSRATRALVASSGQAQKAKSHVWRGTSSSLRSSTGRSGEILTAPCARRSLLARLRSARTSSTRLGAPDCWISRIWGIVISKASRLSFPTFIAAAVGRAGRFSMVDVSTASDAGIGY